MAILSLTSVPLWVARYDPPATFWRSLLYFNIYRLAVALLFLLAGVLLPEFQAFQSIAAGFDTLALRLSYLGIAIGALLVQFRLRPNFNLLLTVEVVLDIAILTLLMYAGGGSQSGFGYMIMVVLAGAGLVSQGRLSLFFASLASLSVMTEQWIRIWHDGADPMLLTRTGVICVGFFGVASVAHLLSRRVAASEHLASLRGEQLAQQMRINDHVIRDMQDGVLVIDEHMFVRQHNPAAERLCDCVIMDGDTALSDVSLDLDVLSRACFDHGEERTGVLRIPHSGRLIRLRCVPPEGTFAGLVYIEDMQRLELEARQIKLAALGRLTANIAHEIRNPLAAISHAAELLGESDASAIQKRLTSIIGDNTRRLNRLVTDVLELGRRDKAQQELIALPILLQGLVDEMLIVWRQSERVLSVSVTDDAKVWFDRAHLLRVLSNILVNAQRYGSGKEESIKIWTRVVGDGKHIEIHLADDGPGIPADLKSRVFEPFFTTYGKGTGLGLFIARELCEANGASLELMPSANGAHFCITAAEGQL